jgi:hypothetical protein
MTGGAFGILIRTGHTKCNAIKKRGLYSLPSTEQLAPVGQDHYWEVPKNKGLATQYLVHGPDTAILPYHRKDNPIWVRQSGKTGRGFAALVTLRAAHADNKPQSPLKAEASMLPRSP